MKEDDGLVNFRGCLVSPELARCWAQSLMEGFDELPVDLRDLINYGRGGNAPVSKLLRSPGQLRLFE